MYIYVIRNIKNGKIYIGQTIQANYKKYFYNKCWDALAGQRGCPHLFNAIRKYGSDSFEIEPLVIVSNKKDLDFYERFLISEMKSQDRSIGYNLAAGGEGPSRLSPWNKGMKNPYSSETLSKMSASQKRRAAHYGSPNKGIVRTEEQKRKISETLKERGISPSLAARRKGGASASLIKSRPWLTGNQNARKNV